MVRVYIKKSVKISILLVFFLLVTVVAYAQTKHNIRLLGNGNEIENGSVTPSFTNYTKFGSVDVSSGSRSRTFTMENTSETGIRWSSFTLSGPDASSFLLQPPPSKTVPPLYYQTFTVTFDPSAPGSKTATITIVFEDPDETPYVFSFSGDAVVPVDLYISGSDAPPNVNGVYLYQGFLNEFMYWKHGTENYYLYNGEYAGQRYWNVDDDLTRVLINDFAYTIASENPDPVDLGFWTPGIDGSGYLIVRYNLPEMDVSGNSVPVVDGDDTPSVTDHTDFGKVGAPLGSVSYTYTIENLGIAELNLTGDPLVELSGVNASDFSVTSQPSSAIAAEASTSFTVTFDPSADGLRVAEISIANDDSDENPYNFSIMGTGVTTPSVATSSASSITTSSVTLGGNVTSDGYDDVYERGVIVSSTDNDPYTGEENVSKYVCSSAGTGTFSVNVGSLSIATRYYFRAYAINGEGVSYGEVKEFTSLNSATIIGYEEFYATNADTVKWTLTFGGDVTGLTASNFYFFPSGLPESHITEVSGSGKTWTVSVYTGSGTGSALVCLDNDSGLNTGIIDLPKCSEEYHVDKTVPLLKSTYPAVNATAVYPHDNIVLTFSEYLSKGSGDISIYNGDGTLFEVISVLDPSVVSVDKSIIINPFSVFRKGQRFFVKVDSTAISDQYGNFFEGISDSLTLNFSVVDVVINEVVTEPRNDWSANGFDGTAAEGSTAGSDDEWLELYIKSDSIDFTGWTLELLDGTDVIGDLTGSGAFAVSNYVGGGSFTRSVAGDYLVLGNVAGSGAINNTISILLKDPDGTLIDSVSFGTYPSSNSSDIYNESAHRFANGTDTDSDNDWTQGPATMGATNTGPAVYLTSDVSRISEDMDTVTVTATLNAISSLPVEVTLMFTGTAVNETDYIYESKILAIPAGSLSASVKIFSLPNNNIGENKNIVVDIGSIANGVKAGVQFLNIVITDDDSAPEVAVGQEFSVGVDATGDTYIGTLVASDPDETSVLGGWTITGGNDEGYFVLDEATGELSLAVNPGFTLDDSFQLAVTVSDGDNTSASAMVSIITVIVNDDSPVVTPDQSFTIDESPDDGTIVGVLEATDPDYGAELMWTMVSGNINDAFALDSDGVITVNDVSMINYESITFFTLTVSVSDGEHSADGTVTIYLNNINDNEPFLNDVGFSIDENSADGVEVGNVDAYDADGDELSYSIVSGNTGDAFTIDATGMIAVYSGEALDYETKTGYQLIVNVYDGIHNNTLNAYIDINNLNDNEPVAEGFSATIAEHLAAGTAVGTVVASDADGDGLSFGIILGNTDGAFVIDNGGVITVGNAVVLEFTDNPQFNLEVTVSDGTFQTTVSVVVTLEEDEPTGLEDPIGGNFRVYPNPATDWIYIDSGDLFAGEVSVEIYNLQGAKVFAIKLDATALSEPLRLGNLAPGIYSIFVKSAGKIYSMRFVVI
jgi:hypothetical protein